LDCAVVAVWWRRGLVLGDGRRVGTWPDRSDRCRPSHLFLAIRLSREKGRGQLEIKRGNPGQYSPICIRAAHQPDSSWRIKRCRSPWEPRLFLQGEVGRRLRKSTDLRATEPQALSQYAT